MCSLTFGAQQRSTLATSIIFKNIISKYRLIFAHKFSGLRLSLILFSCFFFLLPVCVSAQADTAVQVKDSVAQIRDSAALHKFVPVNIYRSLLDSNIYLNSKGAPSSLAVTYKKAESDPVFFYIIVSLLIILALIKTIYSRYFATLFRVFFNTSLRQNQLTDQLEQAKLPSLIFNIFFVLSAGLYVYLLLHYFTLEETKPDWYLIGLCMAAVGGCYLVKFISLKFTGWVTAYKPESNIYIFIIFLLNKIIGILLLPFIIVIMFSTHTIASYAVFISLIFLGLVLLLRFFRSYSLLQNRLKVSRFHFFLYILAFEILPLALIYKAALLFLGINS